MNKGRILVVEDDGDISNMLKIYFSGQGYEVQVAPRGGDALTMTSGPKRGQTFHRLSSGFLRRTEGGVDTALRCIRRVSNTG